MNQLVGASEAVPDLGFMAWLLAPCSLSRTNPGNRHQYKRQSGPYKLIMVADGTGPRWTTFDDLLERKALDLKGRKGRTYTPDTTGAAWGESR